MTILVMLLLFPAALAPSAGAATVSGGATRLARGLLAHIDAHPTARFPVILQMQPVAGPHSSARAADDALSRLRLHGQAITALPIIDGAAGVLPATAIRALANDPAVSFISEDLPVRRRDAAISSSALTTAYPPTVGAPWIWQKGDIGQGVTVAVLDSGILQDPDLVQPNNRILAAVNFADPLGSTPDPGGHGTHVAGIIAGNGTRSAGQFIGIAPGANLVDVRVLTAAGSGSASSVVAGIQWVVNHRDTYNIRVLNLSLGAPTSTGYEQDPISAASEIAWLRGIVVIAATGNGGSGAVDSPGIDPYLISVGATDDNATNASSDDLLPTWSGWASLPFGPKPDLVAPGRRIVSIRAPGSTLDGQLPDHVVAAANGSSYFRLTGTSMAAAVTSGAAALLLEQHSGLSPAQVKSIVTSTAQQFGQSTGISLPSPIADGAGLLNAASAYNASPGVANRGLRAADGAALSLYQLLYGQPLVWKDSDYQGVNWNALTWGNLQWNATTWDNLSWDNFDWTNLAWDNLGWDNLGWDSVSWQNLGWDAGSATAPLD